MHRSIPLSFAFTAAATGHASVTPQIVGNVRLEALSPSLVRIEMKGAEGFEDRLTFHVANRDWPGFPVTRQEFPDAVFLRSSKWTIRIPKKVKRLKELQLLAPDGSVLYKGFGDANNSPALPSPGTKFAAWSLKDGPRIVPGPQGLTASDDTGTFASTSGWDLKNNAPDVYVFLPNSDYRQLRSDFLKLTGPAEMPPLYMFGFIDSRWFAYTEQGALDRIQEYRRRHIPLDVLVLDTDWRVGGSHGYAPDTKYLPDMPRYFKEVHALKVRTMFNDHPEPKAEGALDPLEMRYRTDNLTKLLDQGLDVWWYDRNWFTSLHEPLPGLRKEVWGMRLYHDVTQKARPQSRPVIMANVDGIDNGTLNHPSDVSAHRFPVQWTGDTSPTWDSLKRAVSNVLTDGVEDANPYIHEDLGGHTGMPSPDLYSRYLEYGSLGPISRVHCTKDLDHAPWVFGPQAEKIATEYIRLRYRLLPLIYSSAHEAYSQGDPIVRRLDLQYPGYEDASRLDQYLLGKDLLCAPIVEDTAEVALGAGLFHTPDGKPGLSAEYFTNENLEGTPRVTRIDRDLNFDWGQGSPDNRIPVDHFSARWTGKIGPIPGDKPIHLAITADDGVRVYLDGTLVADEWKPQDSVTTVIDPKLQPGSVHDLKVEYYEKDGNASCRLRARRDEGSVGRRSVWIPPGTWTNLWNGQAIQGPRTIQVQCSLEQMPLFVRKGAIVPIAPPLQYTGQRPWSPLTIEAYPSETPSSYTLYEDDGESTAYRSGAFRTTKINMSKTAGGFEIKINPAIGSYKGAIDLRSWKLRMVEPSVFSKPKQVLVDGRLIQGWRVLKSDDKPSMILTGSGGVAGGRTLEFGLPRPIGRKSESGRSPLPVRFRTVPQLCRGTW